MQRCRMRNSGPACASYNARTAFLLRKKCGCVDAMTVALAQGGAVSRAHPSTHLRFAAASGNTNLLIGRFGRHFAPSANQEIGVPSRCRVIAYASANRKDVWKDEAWKPPLPLPEPFGPATTIGRGRWSARGRRDVCFAQCRNHDASGWRMRDECCCWRAESGISSRNDAATQRNLCGASDSRAMKPRLNHENATLHIRVRAGWVVEAKRGRFCEPRSFRILHLVFLGEM